MILFYIIYISEFKISDIKQTYKSKQDDSLEQPILYNSFNIDWFIKGRTNFF